MLTNNRFLEDAAILSKHQPLLESELLRKVIIDHIIEPLKDEVRRLETRVKELEERQLRTYVVAYANLYCNELEMTIVKADSEVGAMLKGARELMHRDATDWLNLLTNKSIEEIQQAFFDTNQLVDVKLIN